MRLFSTAVTLAGLALVARISAAQDFDIVIRNGRVIDPESGLDGVRTLGIRDGRIASVTEGELSGATIIDAKGLVVAPGFIDLHRHAHGDKQLPFSGSRWRNHGPGA